MNKITLLLILVTQFSFAQSMSQFMYQMYMKIIHSVVHRDHHNNNYDLDTNVLTIQTDNASLTNLKFTAQIRFQKCCR